MEAGRVGYSTIDSFSTGSLPQPDSAPKLADEKAQMELLREIEILSATGLSKAAKLIKSSWRRKF